MNSRLKLIRKELRITQEVLAQKLGVGKSNISMIETGKATLSERNKKILVQELNINPKWLDEGVGDMFLPAGIQALAVKGEKRLHLPESIPLYDLENLPGLVALFKKNEDITPKGYINIPNIPKCDGAAYIAGDNMYPILRSGDIVLYKQLISPTEIFWGDMYLLSVGVAREEYITVRYVRKSERPGRVVLVSENPLYADKEIEISKIKAIAFVKASIRMNSLK